MVAEIETLRHRLGPAARIACDMHWAQTASTAKAMIRAMEPHGLWFAEAPVAPEDIEGLADVAAGVHTDRGRRGMAHRYDAQARLARRACAILQPEMGHKGVTEFMRIATLAQVHHAEMIPMQRLASAFSSQPACMRVPLRHR